MTGKARHTRKRGKCSKISVFLTDLRLRDMSRKSTEADVKRKLDMLSKIDADGENVEQNTKWKETKTADRNVT